MKYNIVNRVVHEINHGIEGVGPEQFIALNFSQIDIQTDRYGRYQGASLICQELNYVVDTTQREIRVNTDDGVVSAYYQYDPMGLHDFLKNRFETRESLQVEHFKVPA